jgi:proteasome lid subunit RPN8/RPN11
MMITQAVFEQVVRDLSSRPPEAAGLLFGPQNAEPLATHWVLDETGDATSVSFTLGVDALNGTLRKYRPCGLTCIGAGHSHPGGLVTPSMGDLAYLQNLFFQPVNADLDRFLFPIFCQGRLHPYIVWRDEERLAVTPAALMLV